MGQGQIWPAGVVAGFDGGKPGGLDGEPLSGVEVINEGANTG